MLGFSNLLDGRSKRQSTYAPPNCVQRIQTDPVDFPPPPVEAARTFTDGSVTVAIASFPARRENLKYCVDSLYDQCDHICVYLNQYEEIPGFLQRPKIIAFLGCHYADLNATGKVFFIDWAQDGYYFTIDDDFVYPENYIETMIAKIERYERRCAVTVHGSIFPPAFDWYYERTAMYQYQGPLLQDRFVHLPGSGSFGVHKSTLKANVVDFLPRVMVDLTFAILCKRQHVPIVSIARPSMWMMNTERSGLFQQFSKVITHHTGYAVAEQPWSFEDYAIYARDVIDTVFARYGHNRLLELELDTDFITAMRNGEIPNSWRPTMTTMRRRMDAMTSDFL